MEWVHLLLDREHVAKEVQCLRACGEEQARVWSKAEQVLTTAAGEHSHPGPPGAGEKVGVRRRPKHRPRQSRVQQLEGDHAILAHLALEKVEALFDELAFVHKVHTKELAKLSAALQATPATAEPDSTKTDLTAVLKDE
ncbi:UNVERIFIED_CONTAM: hypothetical protein K2H54_050987 [Gekko kuhli]